MVSFHQLSEQLIQLFFQPFAPNETPEIRAQAIEKLLEISGWNWDSYLEKSWLMEQN